MDGEGCFCVSGLACHLVGATTPEQMTGDILVLKEHYGLIRNQVLELVGMNDRGSSFLELADHLEGVFNDRLH